MKIHSRCTNAVTGEQTIIDKFNSNSCSLLSHISGKDKSNYIVHYHYEGEFVTFVANDNCALELMMSRKCAPYLITSKDGRERYEPLRY